MNKSKENKAITLIALIITIIVLLILAGVVINMTVGNNGIIEKSQVATEKYKEQQVKEQLELLMAEAKLQAMDEKQDFTAEYFKTYLETKLGNKVQAQIDEEGILQVTLDGYTFPVSISNGKATIGNVSEAKIIDENEDYTEILEKMSWLELKNKLGVASGYSGGTFSGSENSAFRAFDSDKDTCVGTSNSNLDRNGDWYQYIFGEPTIVKEIKTTGWFVENGGGYTNKQFKRALYITYDGINWTKLYSDENYVEQTKTSEFIYEFDKPTEILGMKFECEEVPEATWNYKLYEVEVYGYSDLNSMKSFSEESGTASGFSGNTYTGNGNSAYNAFDNNLSTRANTGDFLEGERTGDYYQYIFDNKVKIKKIITKGWLAYDGGGYSNNQFKRNLYVTYDGTNWVNLYSDDEFVQQVQTSVFKYEFDTATEILGVKFECKEVAGPTWGYSLYDAYFVE